jgi:hypothetical protein
MRRLSGGCDDRYERCSLSDNAKLCQTFPLACRSLGRVDPIVCAMNLRTPLFASLAVVSALGGVAAAAIAFPSGSDPEPAAAVASATPEVRTETIRRTVHVRRARSRDDAPSRTAAPARTASPDDSGHHRSGDGDSGHRDRGRDDDAGHHRAGHHGDDDDSEHHRSGHHGDDDSGHHGRGRGRGRGGDDD